MVQQVQMLHHRQRVGVSTYRDSREINFASMITHKISYVNELVGCNAAILCVFLA